MRETKAAATLTAALLAPKGEARPAGWRVASRAPEGRPWYADLHDGATAAHPAPGPGEAPAPDRSDGSQDRGADWTRIDAGTGPEYDAAPRAASNDRTVLADPAPPGPEAAHAPAPVASLARIGARSDTGVAFSGDRAPGPGDRVRITARLDRDLHRRLKLASAHLETSSQELIIDALGHYLDGVAAGPMRGHCACLAEGGRRAAEACGSCGPEAAR